MGTRYGAWGNDSGEWDLDIELKLKEQLGVGVRVYVKQGPYHSRFGIIACTGLGSEKRSGL